MAAIFVEIPSDRMMQAIISLGYHATKEVVGREVVVDIHIPDCLNVVRVFTSIADGQDNVRKSGVDAIRVLVGVQSPYTHRFFPVRGSVTLKRTAPLNPKDGDRVGAFLTRFLGVVRSSLELAKAKPATLCPRCFNPLCLRTRKYDGKPFLGCCAFFSNPQCKFCMDVPSDY